MLKYQTEVLVADPTLYFLGDVSSVFLLVENNVKQQQKSKSKLRKLGTALSKHTHLSMNSTLPKYMSKISLSTCD